MAYVEIPNPAYQNVPFRGGRGSGAGAYIDPSAGSSSPGGGYNYAAASNAIPNEQVIQTASDRLASRIAAKQRADDQSVFGRYASFGRAGSGGADGAFLKSRAANTSALGAGLADLNEQFEQSRLQGAGILANLGANENQYAADSERNRIDALRQAVEERLGTNEQELKAIDQKRTSLLDLIRAYAPEGANTRFASNPNDAIGNARQSQFEEILAEMFGAIG